jgi:hypothetical protein
MMALIVPPCRSRSPRNPRPIRPGSMVRQTYVLVVSMAGPHPWESPSVPGTRRLRSPLHHPNDPIVSTITRAAVILGVDAERLGRAVRDAQVEPWPGRHADGSEVYSWWRLVEVARPLGPPTPPGGPAANANGPSSRNGAARATT